MGRGIRSGCSHTAVAWADERAAGVVAKAKVDGAGNCTTATVAIGNAIFGSESTANAEQCGHVSERLKGKPQ